MQTRIALAFTLVCLASAGTSRADVLLIADVTVLSPERISPLADANVLIEDGYITRVTTMPIADTVEVVIDGRGRYLTPGLIDSHVHLGSTGGMRGDHAAEHPALVAAFREREPLSYLAFGFTTLIDVSTRPAFVANWNQQALRPDLHYCIGVPFANGYGMAFEPEDTRFDTLYFLYDEQQADVIPSQHAPADHTPEAVVRKVLDTDAVCIKSYYESGFGGLFDFPVPSTQLIRSLVREAHAEGLRVLLHGNGLEAYRFALDTGVDALAHGPWHWDEWNTERQVTAPVKQILDGLAEGNIGIQLTARVIYGEYDLLANRFLDDVRLQDILPAELLSWYRTADAAWFQRELYQNYTDNPDIVENFIGQPATGDIAEPTQAAIARLGAAARYLASRDSNFLFGTDSPSSPTYTNPPGLNGYLEILSLAELGVSNEQIFAALTTNNAKAFGLGAAIGTVEVGKKAHLLLLRDNPLQDPAAWNSIDIVFHDGQALPRSTLLIDKQ